MEIFSPNLTQKPWGKAVIATAMLSIGLFAIWNSLPEETKLSLLDLCCLPPPIQCPDGFSQVEGQPHICSGSGLGCPTENATILTCGVTASHTSGTATALVLPAGWEAVEGTRTYSRLRAGFGRDIDNNLIVCEAHGRTPDCGDTGRRGNESNIVRWSATIRNSK